MVLTEQDIRAASTQPDGSISISPFDPTSVKPASLTLHVGSRAVSSANKLTDIARKELVKIRPGEFVTVTTLEAIRLDEWHAGRFSLASSYTRCGLVAAAGPRIEPGFDGRLGVSLTNLSMKPITLAHKSPFLNAEFHRLEKPGRKPYSRQHQNRAEMAPKDVRVAMERDYRSQTELMRTLETLVSTTYSLKQSVNVRLPLTVAALLALFGSTMASIVAFL